MSPTRRDVVAMTRRHFFERAFGTVAGISLGSVALATLLEESGYAQQASSPFVTGVPATETTSA